MPLRANRSSLDANLTGATVEQAQLDHACGSDTKLPPDLNLKPCLPP